MKSIGSVGFEPNHQVSISFVMVHASTFPWSWGQATRGTNNKSTPFHTFGLYIQQLREASCSQYLKRLALQGVCPSCLAFYKWDCISQPGALVVEKCGLAIACQPCSLPCAREERDIPHGMLVSMLPEMFHNWRAQPSPTMVSHVLQHWLRAFLLLRGKRSVSWGWLHMCSLEIQEGWHAGRRVCNHRCCSKKSDVCNIACFQVGA